MLWRPTTFIHASAFCLRCSFYHMLISILASVSCVVLSPRDTLSLTVGCSVIYSVIYSLIGCWMTVSAHCHDVLVTVRLPPFCLLAFFFFLHISHLSQHRLTQRDLISLALSLLSSLRHVVAVVHTQVLAGLVCVSTASQLDPATHISPAFSTLILPLPFTSSLLLFATCSCLFR